MNAWITTQIWYQRWQIHLIQAKEVDGLAREVLCRTAMAAQAKYVMALALEKE